MKEKNWKKLWTNLKNKAMERKIEFFGNNYGDILLITENDSKYLTEKEKDLVNSIYMNIARIYPEAFKMLNNKYSKYRENFQEFRWKIVTRFIKCNFGKFDQEKWDIENNTWNIERVDCPLRGECELEGIVCLPKIKNSLSSREIQIVELLAKGKSAKEIAESLHITFNTANTFVHHISLKLHLNSSKRIIAWYNDHRNCFTKETNR